MKNGSVPAKAANPAAFNFQYSGLVTHALLLGNVALRFRRKLRWDGPNFKITNVPEANKYLHCPYRQGWTL